MRAGAVERALADIAGHPDFRGWQRTAYPLTPSGMGFDFDLEVEMPPAWAALGESPNGVAATERVFLQIPDGFPGFPPVFRLRSDFPRSFPHLQPGGVHLAPRPCLVAGSEANLFWRAGVRGMLVQLCAWLHAAARGTLNADPTVWEPARRDSVDDFAFVDLAAIQPLPTRRQTFAYMRASYCGISNGNPVESYRIVVSNKSTALDPPFWKTVSQARDGMLLYGTAPALILSTGQHRDGTPKVNDQYAPDTVSDLVSLRSSLARWGCVESLNSFLGAIERHAAKLDPRAFPQPIPLLILVNVARPRPVAGFSSHLETFGYVLEISAKKGIPATASVRYAAVLQQLSADLLRRFNQVQIDKPTRPWGLIGAGSLGSKIALHMARSGRAPSILIDDALLDAHNYARHATIPEGTLAEGLLPKLKARSVSQQLAALQQPAVALFEPIQRVLGSPTMTSQLQKKSEWLLLNTTASVLARHALVEAKCQLPRVAEASLFGSGRIGYLGVEGPGRNPDLGELFAEMTGQLEADHELAAAVLSPEAQLEVIRTGLGCGSETMKVTDAGISLHAAAISTELARLHRDDLDAESGSILLGKGAEDSLGSTWTRVSVPPFVRVDLETSDPQPWSLHLSAQARKKIEEEVARYPAVETGGVIWGCVDEAIGAIYVLDVIEAPSDSRRGPAHFDLGIEGLNAVLTQRQRQSFGHLHTVGTSHSHLQASGPSGTDRSTARVIADRASRPNALLIWTPAGYRGLLAESSKQIAGATPDAQRNTDGEE